jgi:recombination protein RecR
MPDFAEPLSRLINEFKHLPGIGQKSAQRLAFHVLRASREDADHLSQAILDVKEKLALCRICNNISESELCIFCRDPNRDQTVVCVVEEPQGILGIETTRQFPGLYHVLHGALSTASHWAGAIENQEPDRAYRPGFDQRSDLGDEPDRRG